MEGGMRVETCNSLSDERRRRIGVAQSSATIKHMHIRQELKTHFLLIWLAGRSCLNTHMATIAYMQMNKWAHYFAEYKIQLAVS